MKLVFLLIEKQALSKELHRCFDILQSFLKDGHFLQVSRGH